MIYHLIKLHIFQRHTFCSSFGSLLNWVNTGAIAAFLDLHYSAQSEGFHGEEFNAVKALEGSAFRRDGHILEF